VRKLNAKQEKILKSFAMQLWRVGFVEDIDLCESTCGCCDDKRKLAKKVTKKLDKAQ
jgi:hypothetical protein